MIFDYILKFTPSDDVRTAFQVIMPYTTIPTFAYREYLSTGRVYKAAVYDDFLSGDISRLVAY